MEVFKDIFGFLVDNNRRLSAKALMIISAVAVVFITNDITGFTYYYNMRNKIEQLKQINSIKQDPITSRETKIYLSLIENDVVSRKSNIDIAWNYVNTLYNSFKSNSLINSKHAVKNNNIQISEIRSTRNEFWFLLTSSGFFILTTLIGIPAMVLSNPKEEWGAVIVGGILIIGIMAFFS